MFHLSAAEVPRSCVGHLPTPPRDGRRRGNESDLSATDKAKNKIEDLGGKAKESIGKITGDRDTENEGRGDQAKSALKDAGEKVKDAFKH